MPHSKEEFHVITTRNVVVAAFSGENAQKRAQDSLKYPGWRVMKVITTIEDVTPTTVEA